LVDAVDDNKDRSESVTSPSVSPTKEKLIKPKKPMPKKPAPVSESDYNDTVQDTYTEIPAKKPSPNPLMSMLLGGGKNKAESTKTAEEDLSDDDGYGAEEFDNEFDALNADSTAFYEMNTYDFFDG